MPVDRWARRLTCRRGMDPRRGERSGGGWPPRPVIPSDLTLQAWAMGRGAWRAWGRRRTPWAKVSAMRSSSETVLTYLLTYHGPGPLSRTFSLSFRLSPLKPGPPGKAPPRALETSGELARPSGGEIYGVPRLGQSSVQSDLADRNFEF